jgi:hypothetical protein
MAAMHRIVDRGGRLVRTVLTLGLAGAALTCPSSAVAAPPAHAAACPGRQLLTCWEKIQAFTDDVTWDHAGVLDLELFENSLPLPLGNPALGRFWRFETSTAGARSVYEYVFQNTVEDDNFEAIATVPVLPRPAVSRHGVVDRRTAGAMSRLMQAEQAEVLNLQATDTSLNRATTAQAARGRADWIAWQLAAAARFATRTANAIGAVISDQRAVSRALIRRHLPFGVGSVDLKLGQRRIRRHGLAPSVRATMQSIGMDALTIAFCINAFETADYGQYSFSLTQYLAQPSTIRGERGFQAALRHFAARVPPTSQPPS